MCADHLGDLSRQRDLCWTFSEAHFAALINFTLPPEDVALERVLHLVKVAVTESS